MKRLPLLLALLFLLFLTWHSARTGYASLLTANVVSAQDLPAAATAVRLSPGDPYAHVVFGALLEANDNRAAAIPHFQTAVVLRPDDYGLRMQLARGQELEGDTAGAINSATVAVTLAPFYAQPHWQLGNILVRAGRRDGGFSELRIAGASNPTLLPAIVDLAWQLSGGKAEYVEQVIQPRTPATYKAVADNFKKHNQVAGAIKMLAAGGEGTAPERRAYVGELIAARKFHEAHSLWSVEHGHSPEPDGADFIVDPGFEEETKLDEPGFSWRTTSSEKAITLSLDNADPKAGRTSLRVDFNGATNAGAEVISQLVLVGSKTHYRCSFAVRTAGLVSGGLPNFVVVDAGDNKLLGQTGALPQTTNGWQTTTIDFTTGESTTAIRISLQRQPCPAQQCPIFGKLWLDDFRLKPDVRGQGSEVSDQRSEVRSQRPETIKGQKPESAFWSC